MIAGLRRCAVYYLRIPSGRGGSDCFAGAQVCQRVDPERRERGQVLQRDPNRHYPKRSPSSRPPCRLHTAGNVPFVKSLWNLVISTFSQVSTREEVQQLLSLDEYIDLVIPRGSNQLVKYIMNNTSIPVLGHADGICAVYLDKSADLQKAIKVIVDAKTQYPAVCNAAEKLLVHRDAVEPLLPEIAVALAAKGVVMHADKTCMPHINPEFAKPLTDDAFKAEYLQLEITVAAVDSLDQAVDHINTYGYVSDWAMSNGQCLQVLSLCV